MTRRSAQNMLLCLLFSTSLLSAAEEITWNSEVGNTLYNLPAGWSKVQKGDALYLTPPGVPEGQQAAIVITSGSELKGDFKPAFVQFRQDQRGIAVSRSSETQSVLADEGYPVLYAGEEIGPEGKVEQYRLYLASNPKDRFEMVMLVASTDALYKQFTPAFEQFVKTLSYKTARPGAHATTAPATTAPATRSSAPPAPTPRT